MAKRGRFYLGRVVNLGNLNQAKLVEAITGAAVLNVGKITRVGTYI